jgi:internalin A
MTKRLSPGRAGFLCLVGPALLGVLLVSCDDKKAADTVPSAALPSAHALPPPPPAEKEIAPVEKEEEIKKKDPKDCKPGKTVDFGGDTALENQVRLKLSKPEGDIAVSDLPKIKSINLSQVKINQLDPCIYPHFTGVKDLFLGQGKLDDLGPIAGLHNIESLRASLNRVTDLKPLATLTKMDRLDLGHTRVSDLSPLANMTSLTDLQVDDTQVSDLAPLASCTKLERLSIQRTNVKDLSPLKGLDHLKFLYVTGAPINDKSVLGALSARGLKIVDE